MDKPHQEQEALEQKQLEDKQFIAVCSTLTPMYFLFFSPVLEVDPLEDIDEEAFGFFSLLSDKACKTQQIHEVFEELEGLLEVDMDENFGVE